MKVAPRDIEAKSRNIGAGIVCVLLYGPDTGRAFDLSKKIARQVVDDLEDPFLVSRPQPVDLKENAGLLLDEINAIPMLGGRKLVRYDFRGSGNEVNSLVTEPVKLVLKGAQGDGLVVVTAGDIKASSALVKTIEKAPNALAIACYRDDAKDLSRLIAEKFQAANLSIERGVDEYLRAHLGNDRAVTLNELEKIILYKTGDATPLTLREAESLIGDSSQMMLADMATAVTSGNIAFLETLIGKAASEGEQPIAILRVVQIRFQRLYQTRSLIELGTTTQTALKKLQPPVFWKDQDAFNHALNRWSLKKLGRAISILFQAEVDCKTTGNPAETIMARCLLQLANAARRAA